VGMLYDATRCIGCRACVTACKTANDLPGNLYDPPNDLNSETKNIIKKYEVDGELVSYMKAQCMHCLDPGCVNACMIGAFQKREHGIVTWDGESVFGMAYLGRRLTYQEKDLTFEVNLFDFEGNLYGSRLRIHCVEHIRDERRFAEPAELQAQLVRDRETASRILEKKR